MALCTATTTTKYSYSSSTTACIIISHRLYRQEYSIDLYNVDAIDSIIIIIDGSSTLSETKHIITNIDGTLTLSETEQPFIPGHLHGFTTTPYDTTLTGNGVIIGKL